MQGGAYVVEVADANTVVSGGEDNCVKVWSAPWTPKAHVDIKCVAKLEAHDDDVLALLVRMPPQAGDDAAAAGTPTSQSRVLWGTGGAKQIVRRLSFRRRNSRSNDRRAANVRAALLPSPLLYPRWSFDDGFAG